MRTIYQEITLSVDTKKNATPNGKLIAGRLAVDEDGFEANFKEEEDSKVIVGASSKTKRLYCGNGYSVRYNPEEDTYYVRLAIKPSLAAIMKAGWNFEECVNYIKRRIYS